MNDDEGKEVKLSDIFKKIQTLGSGQEENLKNILREFSGAKEVVSNVVQNAKLAKDDVAKLLQEELHKHVGKMEIEKIIDYIAENYDLDLQSKISLKRKKKKSTKKSDKSE